MNFQGEQGIMLTTLLAAYHQMLKESIFINWWKGYIHHRQKGKVYLFMLIALLVVIFTWLICDIFVIFDQTILILWYVWLLSLCIVVVATGNIDSTDYLFLCWLHETILVNILNETPWASSKIYLALWNDNHYSKWFEHCPYRSFRQRTRSLELTQLMRFVVVWYFARFKKLMFKFGTLWMSSSTKFVPVSFKRVEANSSPETVQVKRLFNWFLTA